MRVSRLSVSRRSSRALMASVTRSSRFADSPMRVQLRQMTAEIGQAVGLSGREAVDGLGEHERQRVFA